MIGLSDEQLQLVMSLSTPIPVEQRDGFLRELAAELRLWPDIGAGELHRLCVEVRHRITPWTTDLAVSIR
jgi:hypothetical protein